jgi:hypothetical protein
MLTLRVRDDAAWIAGSSPAMTKDASDNSAVPDFQIL